MSTLQRLTAGVAGSPHVPLDISTNPVLFTCRLGDLVDGLLVGVPVLRVDFLQEVVSAGLGMDVGEYGGAVFALLPWRGEEGITVV